MRRHGFTLTEVLIVIAIIGILAAILFPVLARAKGSARQSQCASHLSQIGHALDLYANDWDGYLPCFTTDRYALERTDALFLAAMGRYIRNNETWFCPSDRYRGNPDAGSVDHTKTSYFTYPLQPDRPARKDGPWRDEHHEVVAASRVIFAFDDIVDDIAGEPIKDYPRPHGDGRNYLYVDGHVGWKAGE
jgi:prepilin-type N-terminal cleavage/methylation domain-containing protein/prepilin-type processing-associated H-X9-DG protein